MICMLGWEWFYYLLKKLIMLIFIETFSTCNIQVWMSVVILICRQKIHIPEQNITCSDNTFKDMNHAIDTYLYTVESSDWWSYQWSCHPIDTTFLLHFVVSSILWDQIMFSKFTFGPVLRIDLRSCWAKCMVGWTTFGVTLTVYFVVGVIAIAIFVGDLYMLEFVNRRFC